MPLDESFSKFLHEEGLTRSASLEKLRGCRIAIDAHHWIKTLAPRINEPFQAVMGGVPLTMRKAIRAELQKFKSVGIVPVFVFNGLPIILTQAPSTLVQNPFLYELYDKREEAWHAYHEGKPCRPQFENTGGTVTSSEFQQSLIRLLREENIEFFKAPYIAWAQMALWVYGKDQCVHQVQGPNELIMFDHISVLLLDFHFDSSPPEFEYIIKQDIIEKLSVTAKEGKQLTNAQFLDCCLLTGLRGQMKHQKIPDSENLSFSSIAEKMLSFGKVQSLILARPPLEEGPANQILVKNHMRIRAIIRHSLVFSLEGEVLPLTRATVISENGEQQEPPCNLSDLWGHRLPNILYYLLSVGSLQTQVLVHVVQNQMIEMIPVIDTAEYRDLLQKIHPLKTQVAHHLIHQLGGRDEKYILRGSMICWRWFTLFETLLKPPQAIKLDEWDVQDDDISSLLGSNPTSKIGFAFVIRNFNKMACREKVYHTFSEVLCAVYLKSLDILGYFTHTRTADPPVSGLSRFSEALMKADAPEFCEYLILVIELLRTRALTRDHFTYRKPDPSNQLQSTNPWGKGERDLVHFPELKMPPVYLKGGADQQQQYEWCTLLISRIVSLLPMELSEYPWFAEISKDLLGFNTLVKALHKTLRNLTEVVSAVLFLDGRTAISPDKYQQLPTLLPYSQESNTAMGIVFNYIMRSSEDFGKTEITNREQRIAHLQEKFPCCLNIEGDLMKAFRFWQAVQIIFTELREEENCISPELKAIFGNADAMLRIKLHMIVDLGDQEYPTE